MVEKAFINIVIYKLDTATFYHSPELIDKREQGIGKMFFFNFPAYIL